jgi:tetratricopeptide (TPR) repeat protein
LNNEPIEASQASSLYRALKWGRRHQPLVWSALVCLLISLLAIGGSIGWILRDRADRVSIAERIKLHRTRADAFHQEGRYEEAVVEYQAAVRLLGDNPESLPELADVYLNMADALGHLPDKRGAGPATLMKAIEIDRALLERFPDNQGYRWHLGISLANLGNGYWYDVKRYAAAIDSWEESLSQLKDVLRRTRLGPAQVRGTITELRRRLCFAYAACSDKTIRRPDRALELAVEDQRESPGTEARLMLGVAHVANGDWQTAIDSLTPIEQPWEDVRAFSRLVLMAIASDRLGKTADAEQCIDEARRWLKEHPDPATPEDNAGRELIERMRSFYRELSTVPVHFDD